VQLGYAFARSGPLRCQQAGEAQIVQTVVGQALAGVSRALLVQGFAVVTGFDPRLAELRQTLLDVNGDRRIAVRAGGVIDRYSFSLLPPINVGLSWISRIGTRISSCEPVR